MATSTILLIMALLSVISSRPVELVTHGFSFTVCSKYHSAAFYLYYCTYVDAGHTDCIIFHTRSHNPKC